MTLEDWTDIMYVAMELHPMAWLFFVSFVMLAAVIMINLVIAVVINNLHDARLEVTPVKGDERRRRSDAPIRARGGGEAPASRWSASRAFSPS